MQKLIRTNFFHVFMEKTTVQKQKIRFDFDKVIGSIPNSGDSVEEVREIRKKLSKEPDLD